jgi:hypothetical protein
MDQMVALGAKRTNSYHFPPASIESLVPRDLDPFYSAEIHHLYLMEVEVATLRMASVEAFASPDSPLSSPSIHRLSVAVVEVVVLRMALVRAFAPPDSLPSSDEVSAPGGHNENKGFCLHPLHCHNVDITYASLPINQYIQTNTRRFFSLARLFARPFSDTPEGMIPLSRIMQQFDRHLPIHQRRDRMIMAGGWGAITTR